MRGRGLQGYILAGVMAAVMAVLSPLAIPVGPVPVTLGIFCVALAGALLPLLPALGALSVYMLLGIVGLPVFSGFGAGPGVLLGPTGGYLFGYYLLLAAVCLGAKLPLWLQCLCGAAGLAGCYALGTAWYMVYAQAPLAAALAACVVPFVLPDLMKILLALVLARRLNQHLKRGAT